MPLNREAYTKLVDEDLTWLRKQPRTLERDHIEAVLLHHLQCYLMNDADDVQQVHATADRSPVCGRCYDAVPCFPATCTERPELNRIDCGMYHCPDCGAMVLGGIPHPPLCERCNTRTHPGFDPPATPT